MTKTINKMNKFFAFMVIMVLAVSAVSAFPLGTSEPEIAAAKAYLEGRQNSAGDIAGAGVSPFAVLAIYALGEDPSTWTNTGDDILTYIEDNAASFDDTKVLDMAKVILAAVAAGEDPSDFGNIDFITKLKALYSDSQFGDSGWVNDDFWAVLALCAAGECSSTEAQDGRQFILDNQISDGSWSWEAGAAVGTGDVDDTASAIMALIRSGMSASSTEIQAALAYIKSQQQDDGGFDSFGSTNVGTDAWAVMAITAAGENPSSNDWTQNSNTPIDHILSLQQPDGHFIWTVGTDLSPELMTAYALNALLGVPYSDIGANSDAVSVTIRIEGSSSTIYQGSVDVIPPTTVTDNIGTDHELLLATALGALHKASLDKPFSYTIEDTAYGLYLSGVGADSASGSLGWLYRVNDASPWVGAQDYVISEGDDVLFYFSEWTDDITRISVDDTSVDAGDSFTAHVEYYNDDTSSWEDLDGVTVFAGVSEFVTDEEGVAEITLSTGGIYEIYADYAGFIRSNKVSVTVSGGEYSDHEEITLEAVIMPSVAIEVNTNNLNFGSVHAGSEKSGPDFIVRNLGGLDVELSADVSGDFFIESLFLQNLKWNVFSMLLEADESDYQNSESISTKLKIPSGYTGTGAKSGTLTVWATGIQ